MADTRPFGQDRFLRRLLPLSALLLLAGLAKPGSAVDGNPAPADPVQTLQQRIDHGEVRLSYDSKNGWLKSVLKALSVPADSQGLVFSKTSFQASRIGPQSPRAVFFNDDLYVGWVPGGNVVEIAAVNPKEGIVFYALPQKPGARPRFLRETANCLQCHESQTTGDVPGLLMRSVYPDASGMPVLPAGTFVTTEQSPFKERWGGWYMDGKTPEIGLANAILDDPDHPDQLTRITPPAEAALKSAGYESCHSDAVALMVLAHQTHLHNLLAQADHQVRTALRQEGALRRELKGDDADLSDSLSRRIRSACEPVVESMLFCGEPALQTPVESSSDFARNFAAPGPRDNRGRSLRDLDLHERLFRYPCSYLIYSQQFDALPAEAKQYIYRRLWKVLTGRDDSLLFAPLSDADRDAIYEILRQTKKDLPAYWKPLH